MIINGGLNAFCLNNTFQTSKCTLEGIIGAMNIPEQEQCCSQK